MFGFGQGRTTSGWLGGLLLILAAGNTNQASSQSYARAPGAGNAPGLSALAGDLGRSIGSAADTEREPSRASLERKAQAGARSSLAITLRIYNYAALSEDSLAGTEAAASSIFKRAGIETIWLACPRDQSEIDRYLECSRSMRPTDFVVRLASRTMVERLDLPSDAFGFGLPCAEGRSGCYADVFPYRVEALAAEDQVDELKLMGDVLAHEVGHLLLGPNSHGVAGIMQARWSADQIEAARRSRLTFTDRECRQMRENVRRRASEEISGAGAAQDYARAE